jgi:hypothetical protein
VNEVSEEIFFLAVEAVFEGQFLPDRPLTPLERVREAGESEREDEDSDAIIE